MLIQFETNINSKTVTIFKEVLQILESLKELHSITNDLSLLQDLDETFSHYESIKNDILIEISNELGLQFETTIKDRYSL